jgi:spore germination protein YaaH
VRITHNESMRRSLLPLATAVTMVAGLLVGQGVGASPVSANAPDRVLSGWMPYWMTSPGRPSGVDSAVANADLFEDVSPFWYSATARSGGGVQVRLNPNFGNAAANIAWAMPRLRGAGLIVIPSIADASGRGRMASTLADPGLRAQHIADLVALTVDNGYDGLDINYENFAFSDGRASWEATQPNWTTFVAELSAALRAQGKLLSVTIPGPCDTANRCGGRNGYWVYNLPGIAPYADRVRIMAYDFTVQSIGPIAPIGWVRANVEHAVTVMDPAKLQIGVPTYGRARTRTVAGGGFRLSGVCPNKDGSTAERQAWRSATAMSSVTAREIPNLLARNGLSDADVTWNPETQESFFRYIKKVEWTDGAGNPQVCNAERQVNFVGPDAVLARTQLVGQYGLNGAALWTIGGENPAQWSVLRSYAQSLAPAEATLAIDATPAVAFGQPTSVAGGVTLNGSPVPNASVGLEFQPTGSRIGRDSSPPQADRTERLPSRWSYLVRDVSA